MGTAGTSMLASLSQFLPPELSDQLAQLGAVEDDHTARLERSSRDLARVADAVEEIRDAVRTVAGLAPLLLELKEHPFFVGLLAGKSAMSVARKKS